MKIPANTIIAKKNPAKKRSSKLVPPLYFILFPSLIVSHFLKAHNVKTTYVLITRYDNLKYLVLFLLKRIDTT